MKHYLPKWSSKHEGWKRGALWRVFKLGTWDMVVVLVIYSEFNLSSLVRSSVIELMDQLREFDTHQEFRSYTPQVISKCYLRGVRDDDKSQSVSRHHRQLWMEVSPITAAPLSEARAQLLP